MSEEEVGALFQAMDANKDGGVSAEESKPDMGSHLKCNLCMQFKLQDRFLLVEHDTEAANCVTKEGRHICIQCVNQGHRKAPIYREP